MTDRRRGAHSVSPAFTQSPHVWLRPIFGDFRRLDQVLLLVSAALTVWLWSLPVGGGAAVILAIRSVQQRRWSQFSVAVFIAAVNFAVVGYVWVALAPRT